MTSNINCDILYEQLPKTVGAVKRKDQNAYRGESDLLRKYEFTNLCVFVRRGFLLWQYTQNVTVQPALFVKPHFVLIAAAAAVLLIDGRSAHLTASRRILMRA